MDDTFLAALFPRRHRILRFRLRPFCYGHLAALDAVGSPLIAEPGSGAVAGAGDLLLALRICATAGYPDLAPEDLGPRWRDAASRWWLEQRPERLRAAVQAFLLYRDDHASTPEFYEQGTDEGEVPAARSLSAPAVLARVCGLISRTTITLREAWALPVAMPGWYIGALDELDGAHVRFASADNEADLPPEEELTEAQLYRRAVEHLGPAAAAAWRKQRRAAQRREKRQKRSEATTHGA